MNVIGIIPSRFGSTRFPGKPLAMIHGKTMIERVYCQAILAKGLSDVIVATDDKRIYDHVMAFGGKVLMTSPDHPNGTSRCAEVLEKLTTEIEGVINIQGDEPYIHPRQIELLIECLHSSGAPIATLVKTIADPADLINVNIPKVVIRQNGEALYFSRNLIPWCNFSQQKVLLEKGMFLKHVGLYGYKSDIIKVLPNLSPGVLELSE